LKTDYTLFPEFDVRAVTAALCGASPLFSVWPGTRGLQLIDQKYSAPTGSLRYKLFVPSTYAGEPMPLLVMLHGCTQTAEDFATGTNMNALAEEIGFLVAYPEQSTRANGSRCWNWFDQRHQHRDEGEPALIAGMTRQIMSEYAVATERVFVAGLSAGGAMAVVMGQTYPDLFAAVGSHSGVPYGAAQGGLSGLSAMRHPSTHPGSASAPQNALCGIPIIVFHGDSDTTVHPANGAETVAQQLGSAEREAGKVGNINTRVTTGVTAGRHYTRKEHYAGDKPVAEHWVLHGGRHAWSGGQAAGSYTDVGGPDAAGEMMRFFLGTELRQA
jgi:poly(hydroxyalkanoate) depolymerase family esterase